MRRDVAWLIAVLTVSAFLFRPMASPHVTHAAPPPPSVDWMRELRVDGVRPDKPPVCHVRGTVLTQDARVLIQRGDTSHVVLTTLGPPRATYPHRFVFGRNGWNVVVRLDLDDHVESIELSD